MFCLTLLTDSKSPATLSKRLSADHALASCSGDQKQRIQQNLSQSMLVVILLLPLLSKLLLSCMPNELSKALTMVGSQATKA